ncbi:MAG: NADP-dependent oxidoreductase, partial [Lapillicoccus sp.]
MRSSEWHLVRRPVGEPVDDDFALVEMDLPAPDAAEILVHNTFLSVDPYMRGRMNDVKSYAPPFGLGEPMGGGATGVVEEVGGAVLDVTGRTIEVGDTVLHDHGWRTHAVLAGRRVRVLDVESAPAQAWLGVLGMTGLTAYAGLLRVAEFHEGDAVFVSAAAGSVGSLVGQIARLKGASLVVGSAGGPEKTQWLLDDLGFDWAIDYRSGPIGKALREAAPDGIDVYFDNVGGDHLEAAISSLRPHGRGALCGMISRYNDTAATPGPKNLALLIGNRLTLRGFLVTDHADLRGQFEDEVGGW